MKYTSKMIAGKIKFMVILYATFMPKLCIKEAKKHPPQTILRL